MTLADCWRTIKGNREWCAKHEKPWPYLYSHKFKMVAKGWVIDFRRL